MRLCIPTETDDGLKSVLHAHFGSAPIFTIIDTNSGNIEVVNNSNQHHTHGQCMPFKVLQNHNIDAVACVGMGARAVISLNEGGIQAYRVTAGSVAEVIEKLQQGTLEKLTVETACTEHQCH